MRGPARRAPRQIDIRPAMEAFARMLAPAFAGRQPDITEENLQSRARGVTLMALSNKFGSMVVSTGNKSEMSAGYATLYGDMCGGYAVLKDVYKTTVFELARWRNAHRPAATAGPAGSGDARARHHQAADRRAQAQPDRPGHPAALRGARRHPGVPDRARNGRAGDRRRAGTTRPWCAASSACSTAPNTSAARRRRASRSPAAPSAATAAIRSSTASPPWSTNDDKGV